MSMNEMEFKVNELRELKRMADELAGEIAALEDDLKAQMTATGADEIHASRSPGSPSPAAAWTARLSRLRHPPSGSSSARLPLSAASSWHKKSPLCEAVGSKTHKRL